MVPCDYLGRRIEGWASNDVVKMAMKNKKYWKNTGMRGKQMGWELNEKTGERMGSTITRRQRKP